MFFLAKGEGEVYNVNVNSGEKTYVKEIFKLL